MAFCGKCGKPVDDGAAFCAACGNPMNAAPAQQPVQRPAQPKIPGDSVLKLPTSIAGWIRVGLVVISFILLFVSWGVISESYMGITMKATASIFGANAMGYKASTFDVHALLGIANIFGVIAIIAFIVYIVAHFVDIGKFVPALSVNLEKLGRLAYFACYALALVCGFIGIIASELNLSVGFFLALVFFIAAVVGTKKGFLEKFIPEK